MNKKKITILLVISILLLVVFVSSYTYALFESNITSDVETTVANWNIKINNSSIINGTSESFVIDSLNYTQTDSNVRNGKFAPGIEGYYDITIDPTDTDVSIKYNVLIDELEAENLKIDRVELISGGTITKEDDTHYSGIIPLSNKVVHRIRVYLVWTDYNTEEANEKDSEIGTRDNPDINIPVTINLIQYLGE